MVTETEGLQNITFEQDIFAAGIDSLQVMTLVRQLRSSFRDHDGGVVAHLISSRRICANPTVFKLATAMQYLADHGEAACEGLEKGMVGKMEGMLAKYSSNIPQSRNDAIQKRRNPKPRARSHDFSDWKHGLAWLVCLGLLAG